MSAFAVTREGKIKWQPKRATLPETLICSQTEAMELLRRQVFEDAIAAKVLAPCCRKPTAKDVTKFYAVRDVQAVATRIVGGEYPDVAKGGWMLARA